MVQTGPKIQPGGLMAGLVSPAYRAGDASRREVRADYPNNKGEGDAEDGQEPGAVPGDVHGCTGASPGDEGDGGGMRPSLVEYGGIPLLMLMEEGVAPDADGWG